MCMPTCLWLCLQRVSLSLLTNQSNMHLITAFFVAAVLLHAVFASSNDITCTPSGSSCSPSSCNRCCRTPCTSDNQVVRRGQCIGSKSTHLTTACPALTTLRNFVEFNGDDDWRFYRYSTGSTAKNQAFCSSSCLILYLSSPLQSTTAPRSVTTIVPSAQLVAMASLSALPQAPALAPLPIPHTCLRLAPPSPLALSAA